VLTQHQSAAGLVRRLRKQRADGWRLRCTPVCTSTEDELSQWLQTAPWQGEYPRAVIADRQIRGKGQRGRHWVSPHGGAWISAALPWNQHSPHADMIGLMVALTLSQRLEQEGLTVRIKWPNDLLVETWKLAGLLPRLVFRGNRLRMVRIGVGMNVTNPVPTGAISLRQLLPRGRARRDVWTVEVLRALERAVELSHDPDHVLHEIETRLWDRRVQDPQTGEFWDIRGLTLNGSLELCQGTRTTSWTRWPDAGFDNL